MPIVREVRDLKQYLALSIAYDGEGWIGGVYHSIIADNWEILFPHFPFPASQDFLQKRGQASLTNWFYRETAWTAFRQTRASSPPGRSEK